MDDATASGFNGVGYFDCLHDELIWSDRTRYQSNLNLPFKSGREAQAFGLHGDCYLGPLPSQSKATDRRKKQALVERGRIGQATRGTQAMPDPRPAHTTVSLLNQPTPPYHGPGASLYGPRGPMQAQNTGRQRKALQGPRTMV